LSLSSSSTKDNGRAQKQEQEELLILNKIALATEGFATKGYQALLSDRTRLSKENALTVCDYIIAMKREVNPRLLQKIHY
jgi:hypothetical protein